ncbi:hypothetical protein P4G83_28690 [Bacillus cereus]|nr:hypothetical protein [Bacillus cereus]
MDSFPDINSIHEIEVLESLREQLASKAHEAELTWSARMAIYDAIQAIVNRITQIEGVV